MKLPWLHIVCIVFVYIITECLNKNLDIEVNYSFVRIIRCTGEVGDRAKNIGLEMGSYNEYEFTLNI